MTSKKTLVLLVVALLLISVVGCGEGGSSSKGEDAVTLRISHVLAEDHPTHTTLVDFFKPEIEKNSNGTIKVEIYPNAQLGSDRQAIESVSMNQLEMTVPGGPVLSGFYEPYMVYDLPFLFSSREAAYAACDGELREELSKGLLEEHNVRILGIGENGFRHTTTNKGPINTPSDLKGMKIRTMESPLHLATFRSFGANPTPMGFNELFTALQQGTVDGQENPIAIIYTSKLYEVQEYMVMDGHYYVNCPYLINEDFWNKLTADQQKVVQDATNLTVTEQRKALAAQEEEYLVKLEEAGLKINRLSDENKQLFIDAAQVVYPEFTNKFGTDLVDLAQSYNQ